MSYFEEFWRRMLKRLREAEEDLQKLFEELSETLGETSTKPMWSTEGTLEPLVQVEEEEDKYVIVIDLPYGDMRALSVTGSKGMVQISCKLRKRIKFDKWGTVQRSTEFREYRKTIHLPEDADTSNFTLQKREDKCMVKIVVPKKSSFSPNLTS